MSSIMPSGKLGAEPTSCKGVLLGADGHSYVSGKPDGRAYHYRVSVDGPSNSPELDLSRNRVHRDVVHLDSKILACLVKGSMSRHRDNPEWYEAGP